MINPGEISQWLEIVVFVGTAVWAVSKIRSTTDQLSLSMDHLSQSMQKLDSQVEHVSRELTNMRDRMTRLETKLEVEPSLTLMTRAGRGNE